MVRREASALSVQFSALWNFRAKCYHSEPPSICKGNYTHDRQQQQQVGVFVSLFCVVRERRKNSFMPTVLICVDMLCVVKALQ